MLSDRFHRGRTGDETATLLAAYTPTRTVSLAAAMGTSMTQDRYMSRGTPSISAVIHDCLPNGLRWTDVPNWLHRYSRCGDNPRLSSSPGYAPPAAELHYLRSRFHGAEMGPNLRTRCSSAPGWLALARSNQLKYIGASHNSI